MGEPKGKLVTPVMTNPDDESRSPECDANDYLKVNIAGSDSNIPKPHADEKFFGIESVINKIYYASASSANPTISSDAVPEGKMWVITHVTAFNYSGATATRIYIGVTTNSSLVTIFSKAGSIAQYEAVGGITKLYLKEDDFIEVYFKGVTTGNYIYLNIFGYEMSAP